MTFHPRFFSRYSVAYRGYHVTLPLAICSAASHVMCHTAINAFCGEGEEIPYDELHSRIDAQLDRATQDVEVLARLGVGPFHLVTASFEYVKLLIDQGWQELIPIEAESAVEPPA